MLHLHASQFPSVAVCQHAGESWLLVKVAWSQGLTKVSFGQAEPQWLGSPDAQVQSQRVFMLSQSCVTALDSKGAGRCS